MTGEITLRGRVLPIGGLKEKLLAASRGGMKTVLIPEENAKDLVEISESIKKSLDIVPVSRMDEVLERALVRKPEAIDWDEEKAKPTETSVTTEPPVEEDSSTLTAHSSLRTTLLSSGGAELRRRFVLCVVSLALTSGLTNQEQRENIVPSRSENRYGKPRLGEARGKYLGEFR
jgi:hypothetical protein